MSTKQNFPLTRFFLAFILTTFLFVGIFLFSYSVSFLVSHNIDSSTNLAQEYVKEMEKDLENLGCNSEILLKASSRLDFIGGEIPSLEEKLGKDDSRILEQKRDYTEVEFAHLSIVKELNSRCDQKFLVILFFYSNNETLEKESGRVGYVLSTFKKENPDRVMVYSFDVDLGYDLIEKLEQEHNITQVPQIVINEKENLILTNINQLEGYLN